MKILLIIKFCAAFANNVYVGSPGECTTAYWRQYEYESVEKCQVAYKRDYDNNWFEYNYVWFLRDEKVTVNTVLDGTCRKET